LLPAFAHAFEIVMRSARAELASRAADLAQTS
jgi:hypothetical protein